MKSVAVLGCALILAAGLAAAEVKPKIIEMDAAEGAAKDHWVAFISRLDREGARSGSAVVAEGSAETLGTAFGLVRVDAKPKATGVDKAKFKELTEGETGAQPVLIKVSVTADQHKKVRDTIAKYTKKEQVNTPNNVTLNFAQEVLDALGLKRPYRSGLAGSIPSQYFTDIPLFNRKKVQDS